MTIDQGPTIEVREFVDETGRKVRYERYVRTIPVSDIEHGARYKTLCGACPEHGKRLSCPPFSPTFADYAGAASTAQVVCIRFPGEYFGDRLAEKDFITLFFQRAKSLLADDLLDFRKKGHVIAGSGPCLACEQCAAEDGSDHCLKPDEQIYSLESLGVNVADLCMKAFGLDLQWSSDGRPAAHVCAVGAVFL